MGSASTSSTCPSQAERLAWLARQPPELPGTGIVYCLTVARHPSGSPTGCARTASTPCRLHRRRATPTSAHRRSSRRCSTTSQGVVATSRARDGLRQARPRLRRPLPGARLARRLLPAGRPGRPRRSTSPLGVLLRGREDERHPGLVHQTAFPAEEPAGRSLSAARGREPPVTVGADRGGREPQAQSARDPPEELEVDGAVRYVAGQGWRAHAAAVDLRRRRVEQVTAPRRIEQEQMRDYALGDALPDGVPDAASSTIPTQVRAARCDVLRRLALRCAARPGRCRGSSTLPAGTTARDRAAPAVARRPRGGARRHQTRRAARGRTRVVPMGRRRLGQRRSAGQAGGWSVRRRPRRRPGRRWCARGDHSPHRPG